jgi:protein tyrosine phosphatase type 4A
MKAPLQQVIHRKSTSEKMATTYFRPAHSEIEFGKMRFLITDRPTDATADSYAKELERNGVRKLVRVCEPTYSIEPLKKRNIDVLDWEFADGSPPPQGVIENWLQLIRQSFSGSVASVAGNSSSDDKPLSIGVHCVAGLGRAPVLVAIALMEAGMTCDDAILLIRSKRRGALNENQLTFLRNYAPSGQLRKLRYMKDTPHKQHKACAIM